MTITEHATEPGGGAGLVARVRGILLHPSAEWDVIDREAATVGGLFTRYACILALIPSVALIIRGLTAFHWGAPLIIADAIVTYAISLAGAFVIGIIIEALAPTFQGRKSRIQAMKLSIYGYTAAWVGGLFNIIPWVGWLGSLAMSIYGLYILYRGLPKLMRNPADKTAGYFVLVLVAAVLISLLIAWAVSLLVVSMMAGGTITDAAFIR